MTLTEATYRHYRSPCEAARFMVSANMSHADFMREMFKRHRRGGLTLEALEACCLSIPMPISDKDMDVTEDEIS